MELILQELIESISQFSPIVSTSLLFILLVVSVLLTKKDLIQNKISSLKYMFGVVPMEKLHHHSLFEVVEQTRSELKFVKFYFDDGNIDEVKSKMFIDFMNIKLDIIKSMFHDLVNKAKTSQDTDHLRSMIFKNIQKSVDSYTRETKALFIEKGISLEDADYVIALFEEWRLDTIKSLQSGINRVLSSEFHYSKVEKMLATFEIISMAVELIPKDGVLAFNQMNGRFKKIKKY
jgi:hypothetical protein